MSSRRHRRASQCVDETSRVSKPPLSNMPGALVFDLDNTLAASKQAITSAMGAAIGELLSRTVVAVVSGGKLQQLTKQVANRLPKRADVSKLYLLPTSGAALFAYENGAWKSRNEDVIQKSEAKRVMKILETAARATGCIEFDQPSFGPRIEYRGSQISLSALGQRAPASRKKAWDPDRVRRQKLQKAIAMALPDYTVRSGGLTTIDVTHKGIDKAYGIRTLSAQLGIPLDRMLYVGDALYPGGNDEVVIPTGIPTRSVRDPNETLAFIHELLS